MGLTLNQIIRRLESLAQSHRQINSVKTCGYDEVLDSADLTYPACVFELQEGNKVSISDRLTYFNFRVLFFDLLNVAGDALTNEYDIKSDLASIAQDFIAMVNYSDYQDTWLINGGVESASDYPIKIANYQLQDLCAGVYVDIEVGVRFDANRCQVPSTINFENDEEMKIITNYIHDVTAVSSTVALTAMASREIIMLWLGDKLLQPVASSPTPDQYSYNADGTFTFGTDVQIGQVIQILNRSI